MNKTIAWMMTTLMLTACGSPDPVGDWANEDNDSEMKDELTLDPDGRGSSEIRISYVEEGFLFELELDYDIDWQEEGDGDYELDLECARFRGLVDGELLVSGCDDFDSVTLECELSEDGERLGCEDEGGNDVEYERR